MPHHQQSGYSQDAVFATLVPFYERLSHIKPSHVPCIATAIVSMVDMSDDTMANHSITGWYGEPDPRNWRNQ
ncbi:hypothetical protein PG997_014674 [Apiospora hydei]|uniref:Uncharacterized protein n=1 Tax=Apiospora hydei TaxID=1337664 RepID=A0ABR1UUK8_9PEZI